MNSNEDKKKILNNLKSNLIKDFLNYIRFWEPPCYIFDLNTVPRHQLNVGNGAFGTVNQVTMPNFPEPLALKLLPPINPWNQQTDVQNIIREIQTLHSCNHSNILPLYGLGVNRTSYSIDLGILTPLKWGNLAKLIWL